MLATRRHFCLAAATTFGIPSLVLAQVRRPSFSNPTPEDARELAEAAVKLSMDIERKVLDFSPSSLTLIDETVLSFRTAGNTAKDVGATLVIFGCYVGEVFVRSLPGAWEMPRDEERKLGFATVGVRTKSGAFWDPIYKVFKLLANGKEDSVAYMYLVARSRER